jgi:hypothetical protein
MINMFGSPPNLCYDAVVETLSTINNTSLPKSPSESVQYPLSRMQRNKCMFVNQLMAEAMMEMVDESEVQSRATQQLINVFKDSVAKQKELVHMLMGVICVEVADCDVVDG